MHETTKASYTKLARYFYKTRLSGEKNNLIKFRAILTEAATDYRPNYFRRLKNALAYDLRARGYPKTAQMILNTKNPVTAPGSTIPKKPAPRRVKHFSDEDFLKITNHLNKNGFFDECVAVIISYYCGARPCELKSISVYGNEIHITGAKKSHDGKRGLDRRLLIEDEIILQIVSFSSRIISESTRTISAIRDRLRKEAEKVWPNRKYLPTLYSIRHQFGSNLKASGIKDSRHLAYLMGHQSTRSIERYGDSRKGDKTRIKVTLPADAPLDNIRIKGKGIPRPTKIHHLTNHEPPPLHTRT